MSLNYQERDGNGDPIKVPLLHGGDTDIDIQLTLSWVRMMANKDTCQG